MPSNRDLGLSLQERWCNLQFVVVTNGELGLCLRWARFLSCLGGGREEGLGKGEKQPGARVCLFSN